MADTQENEIRGNKRPNTSDEVANSKKKVPNAKKIRNALSQTVAENSQTLKELSALPDVVKNQTESIEALLKAVAHLTGHGTGGTPIQNEDHSEGFDPVGSLISSVVDKDVNSERAKDLVDTDTDPIIQSILNGQDQDQEYGPSLPEKVTAAFQKLITQIPTKDNLEKSKSLLKPPLNAKELGVPKVNSEIWQNLPRKAQTSDASHQYIQHFLSRGLVAQTNMATILSENADKIPRELLKSLLTATMDSAAQIGSAFREISVKRRIKIKPFLSQDCAGLCSANVPITEFLFGNNLDKDIVAAKATSKVVKNLGMIPANNFQQRGSYRGRGHFNQYGNNNRNLNFRRPLRAMARGGRRPYRFRGAQTQ